MTRPILTLDAEDVVMAMSDQMTQWQIDPITGKLCLDREEASNHLLAALDKRKPFRRFKEALFDFPNDRRRWFDFEAEEMKRIAEELYEDEGFAVRWTKSPGEPTGLL